MGSGWRDGGMRGRKDGRVMDGWMGFGDIRKDLGFCQNPHCSKPLKSTLKRAKLKHGCVGRRPPWCPMRAALAGRLGHPATLGAVGLDRQMAEQGRAANQRARGGLRAGTAATPPAPPTCPAPPFPPGQASWPQPGRPPSGGPGLGPGPGGPGGGAAGGCPHLRLRRSRTGASGMCYRAEA